LDPEEATIEEDFAASNQDLKSQNFTEESNEDGSTEHIRIVEPPQQ